MDAPKIKYVYEDVDARGNVRRYFMPRGFGRVRMRDPIGSTAFAAQYEALLSRHAAGLRAPGRETAPHSPSGGTWQALCHAYLTQPSSPFRKLEVSTQRTRRRVLEATWDEPTRPGSTQRIGDMPLRAFDRRVVKVLRDRKADTPFAADERLKCIGYVFSWALEDDIPGVRGNPARDVAKIGASTTGFHTWTDEEIAQFEDRHPIGTRARLALGILLYTNCRRSDLVLLGRPHVRPGPRLVWTEYKGRRRHPSVVDIPLLAPLEDLIAQSPVGDLVWLVREDGVPFTPAGIGNWFRDRCDEAGLRQCAAHGLRKAGATRAAENGATAHELMAIFGWKSIDEAERYTREADRRRLATRAMPLTLRRTGEME